jgi:hypothetical protein
MTAQDARPRNTIAGALRLKSRSFAVGHVGAACMRHARFPVAEGRDHAKHVCRARCIVPYEEHNAPPRGGLYQRGEWMQHARASPSGGRREQAPALHVPLRETLGVGRSKRDSSTYLPGSTSRRPGSPSLCPGASRKNKGAGHSARNDGARRNFKAAADLSVQCFAAAPA